MTKVNSDNSYTLSEIAQMFGITRERVRQIEMQALKKLRHPKLRQQWNDILEALHGIGNQREGV